jgi:hypothetical protein
MCQKRIYVAAKNKTYVSLHVKRPTFYHRFNKIWNLSTDFRHCTYFRFQENLSGGNRYIQTDGRTDGLT